MANEKTFGDKIAELCHNYFEKTISSKGKPHLGKEWTVLSAIVQEDDSDFRVVAIGTGTKCLGDTETSADGDLVHDSHAEVVAKRSFVLYLVEHCKLAICREQKSIFELKNEKFELKENVKFHFYSSHPPCGDATIAPKRESNDVDNDDIQPTSKRQKLIDADVNSIGIDDIRSTSNRQKLIVDDIHRTGAKSVEGVDPLGVGADYHALGAVRTKPGKYFSPSKLCIFTFNVKMSFNIVEKSFVTP